MLLSVLLLTASPYISNAETRTSDSTSTQKAELLSQIQALLQVIEKLQAQLALQKRSTTSVSDSSLKVTVVLDIAGKASVREKINTLDHPEVQEIEVEDFQKNFFSKLINKVSVYLMKDGE